MFTFKLEKHLREVERDAAFLEEAFRGSLKEGGNAAVGASAGSPVGLSSSFPKLPFHPHHTLVLGTSQHKPDLNG